MGETAVQVENLSKLYRIGQKRTYKTARESIMAAAAWPGQKFRSLFAAPNLAEADDAAAVLWALKDVNFTVDRGETVGIIGRNGAGKSTLLKVLSRITEPTTGRIRIHGRVGSLLEVGTGFHPELTGRENIFLNGAILGMKRHEIARQFDAIVAFSEVERFIDTPVKHYSSGMYMRLAFAVAAHLEPEVLIVDEVLAVGDAEFQRKCLQRMQDVSKGGRTVLFVSHNMNAIEALCGRVVVIDSGKATMDSTSAGVARYRALGGKAGEVYHRVSPLLEWRGIRNNGQTPVYSPNEDITLEFQFRTGHRDLSNVDVDCAIMDSNARMVIHAKANYVSQPVHLAANVEWTARYKLRAPMLVPGDYTAVVYAKADGAELFWAENVEAFQINAKPFFGIAETFSELRGIVIPEYELDYLR